jgi:ABC-type ATPase involved in cell division
MFLDTNPTECIIGQDITKLSNAFFDMYIRKKNVLFVVDKRDLTKKKVYSNIAIAMHHLYEPGLFQL